jgi:ABC-type nickel/cobalt efflux system permease component RcnA
MKVTSVMNNFLGWIFFFLFIISTNALIYLGSLLNFRESSELILVFSFYLIIYLFCVSLIFRVWFSLHKRLEKASPTEKLQVTFEMTLEEYDKIKHYLLQIRG